MKKLRRKQAKEIRALKHMKDDEIDFTDTPLTRDWSNAVVGKFYRPIKKSLLPRGEENFSAPAPAFRAAPRLTLEFTTHLKWLLGDLPTPTTI